MSSNPSQATQQAIAHLKTIDRSSVRRFVTETHEKMRILAETGQNTHQASLDNLDIIHAYMATLSEEDATKFSQLYVEEMSALTQDTMEKTAAIERQTIAIQHAHIDTQIKNAASSSQAAIIIPAVIFMIVMMVIVFR